MFWGLDSALAYKRHFPSINWLTSYSLYSEAVGKWIDEHIAGDWTECIAKANMLLQAEAELEEIVKLVGYDSLSPSDRLTIEAARSVREDYLQQNAFDDVDSYTSLRKQHMMLRLILDFYEKSKQALQNGADIDAILNVNVMEKIARAKYVNEADIGDYVKAAEQQLGIIADVWARAEVSV